MIYLRDADTAKHSARAAEQVQPIPRGFSYLPPSQLDAVRTYFHERSSIVSNSPEHKESMLSKSWKAIQLFLQARAALLTFRSLLPVAEAAVIALDEEGTTGEVFRRRLKARGISDRIANPVTIDGLYTLRKAALLDGIRLGTDRRFPRIQNGPMVAIAHDSLTPDTVQLPNLTGLTLREQQRQVQIANRAAKKAASKAHATLHAQQRAQQRAAQQQKRLDRLANKGRRQPISTSAGGQPVPVDIDSGSDEFDAPTLTSTSDPFSLGGGEVDGSLEQEPYYTESYYFPEYGDNTDFQIIDSLPTEAEYELAAEQIYPQIDQYSTVSPYDLYQEGQVDPNYDPGIMYSGLDFTTIAADCSVCDASVHYDQEDGFWAFPNGKTGEFYHSNLIDARLTPIPGRVHGRTFLDAMPYRVEINSATSKGRAQLAASHEFVHIMDQVYKLGLSHDQVHALGNFLVTEALPGINKLNQLLNTNET